uniref:Uncharacterized protein n=1 Tax=Plectus sambesii TaxID=2011161 RepID=A0A914VFN1_9BILA
MHHRCPRGQSGLCSGSRRIWRNWNAACLAVTPRGAPRSLPPVGGARAASFAFVWSLERQLHRSSVGGGGNIAIGFVLHVQRMTRGRRRVALLKLPPHIPTMDGLFDLT